MLTFMLASGKIYNHPKEKQLAMIFLVYYRPSMLTSMLASCTIYTHPKEKDTGNHFFLYTIGPQC